MVAGDGDGAAAVHEDRAGERGERAGHRGDAAVDGGAERGLLGLLGHDEQQRVRHDVVAERGCTTQAVSGLSAGTYYWQVKTAGGGVPADNGAWSSFSVSAPALYVKQSPANGATGLGPTVTLQWSAVPDEGYYGLLGHDEQQRVRHDVVAERRRGRPGC